MSDQATMTNSAQTAELERRLEAHLLIARRLPR